MSLQKKIIITGIAITIYSLLCAATQWTMLSATTRHVVAAFLPFILSILAGGVIFYAAWSTWKYQSTPAIILLIISILMAVTIMPVWIYMVRYHINAALHQIRQAPVPSPLPTQPSPAQQPEDVIQPLTQPALIIEDSNPAIATQHLSVEKQEKNDIA